MCPSLSRNGVMGIEDAVEQFSVDWLVLKLVENSAPILLREAIVAFANRFCAPLAPRQNRARTSTPMHATSSVRPARAFSCRLEKVALQSQGQGLIFVAHISFSAEAASVGL